MLLGYCLVISTTLLMILILSLHCRYLSTKNCLNSDLEILMQTEDIEAQEVSKDYGKATKIIILSEQVLQTLDLW